MRINSISSRVVEAGTVAHRAACELVSSQYRLHFGAACHHPLPTALNLYDGDRLVGTTGFCGAADTGLFLEQYLDRPIETYLDGYDRKAIVEIGGFAVTDRCYAGPLMISLAETVASREFEVAVCTVTAPVRKCLTRLGIVPVTLAAATADRISDSDAWGNYYALDPVVAAGNIATSIDAIERHRACLERSAA